MKTLIVSRRGSGFTLIELMVALTIGLVLTLVVAQLFTSSRQAFGTTDDAARMQENARFATHLITRFVHQAGYRTSPNSQAAAVFGAPNFALEGTVGSDVQTPDSVTVRYQGSVAGTTDGVVVNCLGEVIPPGVMSTNTFSIQNVAKVDAGTTIQVPSLVCTTNTGGPQVIVSDVDNMKIRYGEDTDGDGSVNRFVALGAVTNMSNVMALRIALLFRSPNIATASVTDPANPPVYSMHGEDMPTFGDTRIRREVVFTAGIRNRSP